MKPIAYFVLFAFAYALFGQTVRTFSYDGVVKDFAPVLVPATDTTVWTGDIVLEGGTLSNITSSAVTCSILDKQGTPRAFMKDVSIAANSVTVLPSRMGRYMPGGLSWSCSSATAVVGYLQARN